MDPVSLAIRLAIEFMRRLPAIIEAFKNQDDITLDQIFPKTRAEFEAEARLKAGQEAPGTDVTS